MKYLFNYRSLYKNFFLLFFIFYYCVGNFGRGINFDIKFGNANVFEIILILFSIPLSIKYIKIIFSSKLFNIIFFGLMISLLVGFFRYGYNLEATLYCLRLISYTFIAYCLSITFANFYKKKSFMIKRDFYLLNLFILSISLVIYFIFPEIKNLYLFLEKLGIIFYGDPHVGRLVSVYFDPNLYSFFLILPFWLSFRDFLKNPNYKLLCLVSVFLIGVLLTYSRTGIGFLGFVFLFEFLRFLFLNKKINFLHIFIIVLLILTVPFLNEFFSRFVNILNDPSALSRFDYLYAWLDIFKDSFIIGTGYNYGSFLMYEKFGISIFHSSFLLMLMSHGILLTGFFLFYLTKFFISLRKFYKKNDISLYNFVDILALYFFTTFFVFGNFNLIFYFSFWYIMLLVLILLFHFHSIYLRNSKV